MVSILSSLSEIIFSVKFYRNHPISLKSTFTFSTFHLNFLVIVTLECPSKYTCKVLWRTAVEFHNFYKVQRGHDCMDSRRSSGVFTRHDRLSLHNADFHGSQNNQSFGLAASRAGSQTAMDQLSRHGSAGKYKHIFMIVKTKLLK